METTNQITLPNLSGILQTVGGILIAVGVLTAGVGFIMLVSPSDSQPELLLRSPRAAFSLGGWFSLSSGLLLALNGTLILAVSAILDRLTFIVLNTRELAEHAKETTAFFTRVSTKVGPNI
jgi:uncharacterized membrane protein